MILKNKQILLLFTLIILCILSIGCVSANDNMNTTNSSVSNICTNNSQVNVDLETSNSLENENTSIELLNSFFEANTNENLQLNNNEVLASPASTGIYYVDCTSGSDTNDGSQTSPYKTIGKAVTTINTGVLDEYIVNISPGTYAENHIGIKKNITFIKNPYKSGEVIINGNLGQIFFTTSSTVIYNINFNSLTLTNGNASSGAVIEVYKGNMKITNCKICNNFVDYNGAIYIGSGNLTVTESEFLNNFADYGGAAIYHNNGNIIISNSKFSNNSGNYGGAIRSEWSNLTVSESEFINNLADSDSGGAISVGLGNLYCSYTNFINNTAKGKNTYGGAISTAGNTTLINTNFINNIANKGGGIFNFEGTLNCINSIFINNKADGIYGDKINYYFGLGGAIYLEQESNLYCNNGTKFINNTANDGGAIYAVNGCNTTCINTNFINNTAINLKYENTTALGSGGAIKIFNSTLICLSSNFNNNFAGEGSAIEIGTGNGICTNTTFINNIATYGSGVIGLYNSNISCDNVIFNSNKEGVIEGLESNIYTNNTNFINNSGTQINSNNGNVYCFFNSFINNTANNYDISSIIHAHNGDLTCNYCIFFNNTAKNTIINIMNGTCNVDYNWWGINTPNCNVTINGELFNLTNTVYMSVLPTIINDKVNSEYNVNVILNQYRDSIGNLHNLDKTLPSVLVNLNANGGYLSSTNGYLNINNEFSTKYICPSTSGTYSINVNIDNETLTIPIKITGGSNPGLYGENLTMPYGTHQNYTGKLIGNDGKPIIGQHVAIKLSNSKGQSKIYYATTDDKGEYQLEINLYPGDYTAIASYNNYLCTNYIKVLKEESNITSTTLTANRFQAPYGTDANFTGKLTDNTGKVLIGQHISLKLSNSQGQSKIYYANTDVNGEYQLVINLYPGKYIANCTYAGTSVYDSSIAAAAIIVTN